MKQFVSAAVLVAALGSSVDAQPTQTILPPVAAPTVVVPYHAAPIARPGISYTKSGGVVVGADGFYPYHTGDYLLGGTEGLTSYSGHFTMEHPDVIGSIAPRGGHRFHHARPFRR